MKTIAMIGVDPGLRGGMARLLYRGGPLEVEVVPIPVIPARTRIGRDGKTKKVSRDQYDLAGICYQLGLWADAGSVFAYVEQSIPFPPKLKAGSLAQFQRGVARGWAWAFTALAIPHVLVHPRTWQKELLAGLPKNDKKQSSIVAAQRLFPGVDLRRNARCKVPHDGIAEALLIAEYGRRQTWEAPSGPVGIVAGSVFPAGPEKFPVRAIGKTLDHAVTTARAVFTSSAGDEKNEGGDL